MTRRAALTGLAALLVLVVIAQDRGAGSPTEKLVTWSSFFGGASDSKLQHVREAWQPELAQRQAPKAPPSTEDAMEQIREMIARATNTPLKALSGHPAGAPHSKAPLTRQEKWYEALHGKIRGTAEQNNPKDSLETIVSAIFHPPSRPTRLPQSVLRGKYTPMTKTPKGTRPADAMTAQGVQDIIDSSTQKAERWLQDMWPAAKKQRDAESSKAEPGSKTLQVSRGDSTSPQNSTDRAAARLAAAIHAEHQAEQHLAQVQAQVKLDHSEFVTTLGMVKTAEKAKEEDRRHAQLIREEEREKRSAAEAKHVGTQAAAQAAAAQAAINLQDAAVRLRERWADRRVDRLSAIAKVTHTHALTYTYTSIGLSAIAKVRELRARA